MTQPVILLNTPTDANDPPVLLQGQPAFGVGPTYTRMWIGDGTENRLLLSDNPADSPLFGGAGGGNFLPLDGGTLTGPLTITVPANAPALTAGGRGVVYSQLSATNSFSFFLNGAVVIPFVNGVAGSGFLNVGGGNMTGALALSADPINPMQAATKQYVDARSQIGVNPPTSPNVGDFWFDSNEGNLYVWFSDASSSQWVVVVNQGQPDLSGYLPLTGGSLSGPLTLAAEGNAPLQPASVSQSGRNVGRNLLDNALFNVQQRGQGPWTTSVYTADRWVIYPSLDTMTVSPPPLSDSDRAGIGDEAAQYCFSCVFAGNAGAASFSTVAQMIENVRRSAGKIVTVSFYAVANAAGLRLGASLDQNFGTGGSPSATVVGTGQAVTLTTSWARYALTFSLPSASGKTLGTNGDSKTELNIWYSSGTTNAPRAGNIGVQSGTVNIWGVQLEVVAAVTNPPTVTPLEKRDPETDLARCQRFYQTPDYYFTTFAANIVNIGYALALPVVMRASPTVTLLSSNGGGVNLPPSVSSNGPGGMSVIAQTNVSSAATVWIGGQAAASADL